MGHSARFGRDLGKVLVLASSACVCSFLAGLVALYMQSRYLPPSDGAYGMSVADLLRDPFVRLAWVGYTSIGAVVGFAASVLMLRRADLRRAVPAIVVVTVSTAAIFGRLGLFSTVPALLAGIMTMVWFWNRAEDGVGCAKSAELQVAGLAQVAAPRQ